MKIHCLFIKVSISCKAKCKYVKFTFTFAFRPVSAFLHNHLHPGLSSLSCRVFYKIKCDKLMWIMPCHKKMWLHILLIIHLAYEQIWVRGKFLRCNFYIYPLFLQWSTFHHLCLCGRVQYQYYLLFGCYPLSTITWPLSWNRCQNLQYYPYYKNNHYIQFFNNKTWIWRWVHTF